MGSLFNDLDLENSLGGEREGRVREKEISCREGCWGFGEGFFGGVFMGIFQMGLIEGLVFVVEIVLGLLWSDLL